MTICSTFAILQAKEHPGRMECFVCRCSSVWSKHSLICHLSAFCLLEVFCHLNAQFCISNIWLKLRALLMFSLLQVCVNAIESSQIDTIIYDSNWELARDREMYPHLHISNWRSVSMYLKYLFCHWELTNWHNNHKQWSLDSWIDATIKLKNW
jgi:hypothetical protein